MSVISYCGTFICSKKQVAVWGFQYYLFGGIRDIQAGFEKEWWSGIGGPCMMAYTEIGLDVGYDYGLWRLCFPGAGRREGDLDS